MASRDIPNFYRCAVCLNSMLDRTPRGLPCFHTFCEECLVPLMKDKQIICPSCRQTASVKYSDVKQLPVNFFLCQMKDLTSPQELKTEAKNQSDLLCEICKTTPAKYKCIECLKTMCTFCKRRHSSIRKNKDHILHDLCVNHNDIVQWLCKLCNIPLCSLCELEHKYHKEYVEPYQKALGEFDQNVEKIKKIITNTEKAYDDNFDKVMEMKSKHSKVLEQVRYRKHYFEDKVEKAEKMIKVTEESLCAFKEVELEYEKNRLECEELKFRIDNIDEDSFRIKNFPALKQRAEDTVSHLEQNMEDHYGLSVFALCNWPTKMASPKLSGKTRSLQKVKLLVSLSLMGGWDYNKQLASIGGDILTITENKSSHIIRINQQGDILDHFYPEEAGDIVAVESYNDQIYIVQPQAITVRSKDKSFPVKVLKPDVEDMQNIFILDNQNILVADGKSSGNIFWFNIGTNSTECVLQGLSNPTYINVVYTKDGIRYIISEANAHCVKVYSETWNLLHTLGKEGILNYPRGTAVTEQNTILVADQNNHCVSHFNIDGNFLSQVITGQDIEFPTGLLYINNVLWVSKLDGSMKCFQLQYQEQQ